MSELHLALGNALGGKTPHEEADYVEKGPHPFVCQSCENFTPENGGMCDVVEGPYDDGGVEPDDSCRLWTPRSAEEPDEAPEEPEGEEPEAEPDEED